MPFISSPLSIRRLLPALLLASFAWTGAAMGQSDASDEEDAVEASAAGILNNVANEHQGILQLNQESGALLNQSNGLSVGFSASGAAIAESTGATTQVNNVAGQAGNAISSVSITNAINESSGFIALNQSAGLGSQQSNSASIAVTIEEGGAAVALADARMSGGILSNGPGAMAALPSGGATIQNVGLATSGVVTINQDAGFGSQQANVIAVASSPTGYATAVASSALARSGQEPSEGDEIDWANADISGQVGIIDSFNGTSGLVQVNQAAGGYNLQTNVLATAFGNFTTASAISDASLGAVQAAPSSAGSTDADEAEITPGITGSFQNFAGLAQVGQASGHGNVTSNAMTVTLTTVPVGGL